MAFIKVILGGVGVKYTDAYGTTRYVLKTSADKPFECDDRLADSYVRQGVAEYVAKESVEIVPEPGKLVGHLEPAELELMDYNDLKKLAADIGVKPKGNKKADYIEAIAAVEVEIDDDAIIEDGDDELPELTAADPE